MKQPAINFIKIEATGNDFILIDGRKIDAESFSQKQIRLMCNRNFGIGADGLIFLTSYHKKYFGMDYFNSDGCRADMCANGSRALVLFANILGLVNTKEKIFFYVSDKKHEAFINSTDNIKVELFVNGSIKKIDSGVFNLPQAMEVLGFIDTGVPHLVVRVNSDLDKIDFKKIAIYLRYHLMFKKKGTNVNFVKILSKNKLQARTYERGVEDETLSCGTGVTASALLYWHKFYPNGNMLEVKTKGGLLKVMKKDNRIFLEGAARPTYTGQYFLIND
ncbi:MAG: diaminopimelate epimerase [Calditrichales bacterium]|nr:diaminopimelate epimerase [Calditrichales bacterium]